MEEESFNIAKERINKNSIEEILENIPNNLKKQKMNSPG